MVEQLIAAMGAGNNALAQQYATAAQGTNLYNAGRAQSLTEQAQQMQIPVNILTALLSGTQVNAPNFQPFSQNTDIEAAPIYQAGKDTYAAGNDAANRQAALMGQAFQAVGGLAKFSDARLKSNVRRLGTTPGGTPWYSYTIFGRQEEGVMAHEAPPEAVSVGPGGFLMVDYSKVR
jgi:hypothetical protein